MIKKAFSLFADDLLTIHGWFCFRNKRFFMGSELKLNYIEPPKMLRYHLCACINKAEVILL